MKIRSLLLAVAGVFAAAAAVVVLSAVATAVPAVAQPRPDLAPQECTCSRGVALIAAGSRAPSSTVHNCQCGALQCVVHAQSGQLQCR